MAELGQIQRPAVDEFRGKRKLYCVANIFPMEEAPDDYKDLVTKYWDEVGAQMKKIESAGRATKIFCELILKQGDESLNFLKKINERVHEIIKQRLDEGDALIPIESEEIFGPYTDWGNCLRVVFTKEVFTRVLEFFREFSEKRYQYIIKTIDDNLAEAEAGLLIMKDEDRAKLQFPKDIEVFLITPPSYDDIIRWMRDKIAEKTAE